jgi:hypothetical protein
MRLLFVLLFLVSCSEPRNNTRYDVGDCFVELDKDNGLYKILSVHKHTYITRAYGQYISRDMPEMPIMVPRTDNLAQVECFEGDYMKDYMYQMDVLTKELSK